MASPDNREELKTMATRFIPLDIGVSEFQNIRLEFHFSVFYYFFKSYNRTKRFLKIYPNDMSRFAWCMISV